MKKPWLIITVVIVAAVGAGLILLRQEQQSSNSVAVDRSMGLSNQAKTMPDIQNKQAILHTTMGDITLEFYPADAPKAVENFLGLAAKGYYNGIIFHRVVPDFVIQAGDPTGTGRGGDSLWGGAYEDELNPETESYKAGYKKGVVAMANRGANTNTSQFFIMLRDAPLDHLYTIFGHVVAGLDVVEAIGQVKTNPENDKPITDVVIKSVEIKNK
jgi:cyclophilin family peptidyl-prolyl cis-trans isomerase